MVVALVGNGSLWVRVRVSVRDIIVQVCSKHPPLKQSVNRAQSTIILLQSTMSIYLLLSVDISSLSGSSCAADFFDTASTFTDIQPFHD